MCDSRQSHSHISTIRNIILWQSHIARVYFLFVQFCFRKMGKPIRKKFETEKGKPCILVDVYKYSEF